MADNFIVWSNTVVNALVCWGEGGGLFIGNGVGGRRRESRLNMNLGRWYHVLHLNHSTLFYLEFFHYIT